MTRSGSLALATVAVVAGACATVARASEMGRDGPWVFTERTNDDGSEPQQMAATPSAEDNDVWLLLVCSSAEVTASLMHSTAFSPNAPAPRTLTLRSANFPVVTVMARAVRPNQVSIDAVTTRHIFPLVTESDRLTVSMDDAGAAHSYTFSLQPHHVALTGIVEHCLNQDR